MADKKTHRVHQETDPSRPSIGDTDTAAPRPHQGKPRRVIGHAASHREPRKRPRRIRRNALKHGLSVPVSKLPYFQDEITAWYKVLLEGMPLEASLTDEVKEICYEIAVQSCELRRIAEMKRVLSSQRIGPPQPFSQADIIHLMTIIEGFVIPPRTTRLAFDTRAISMLYRIFGVSSCDFGGDESLSESLKENGLTLYQIKRLASFERYENRASVRLRKAVKRLKLALQPPEMQGD